MNDGNYVAFEEEAYSSVSNDIKQLKQNMTDIDFAVDLKLVGQSFSMQSA